MRLRFLVLVSILLLSSTFSAFASSLDTLDKQRQRQPEPKSLPRMVFQEDSKNAIPVESGLQFTLGDLSIEGSEALPSQALLAPYKKLYGTKVGLETLNGIAAELTKKYRDNGYLLSRVVVPSQEVNPEAAHIHFTAIEGYIDSIEYVGDPELIKRFKPYASGMEGRLVGKKPLRHKDFEREIFLLNDVPGLSISSQFQEAPATSGTKLIIKVDQDIVDGSMGWGNTGTESSGPGLWNASIGINTLPAIGARTVVAYSQADHFNEYYNAQVVQSYRFSNGFELSASYAKSSSNKPDTQFARLFDYENWSHTANVDMSYPFIRSRDMNLSAGLSYEHRNSYADLLDERSTSDRLRNLIATLNFDFSDEWGGVTQAIPSITKGLGVFNATDRHQKSDSPKAGAEFVKGNLYLSRNQALPWNFSFLAASETQVSDSHLASYNRYSLGGSQFGRGYDPGVIESDNAFAVSLEPRWTYHMTDTLAIQPFAFVDWGKGWASRKVEDVPGSQSLSSAGGGVRLWGHIGEGYLPDFNFSAYVGKPLERVPGEHMAERFVFQFSLLF